MFEVSNEIADAMHRWREQSGEPFICSECAGVAGIYENGLVGASCARDALLTADSHINTEKGALECAPTKKA
ncbi:MAG: hypothetical protein MJE68_14505 [Proteobacteria bacterium]|nr:hypothetical protein [Pseudomonadota bacterium]